MITHQETFQDTVRGAELEQEFTIDTESSVIFEILRDKMYKDKIGAICREVASNARDANREAGSELPIEVQIISPNKLLSMGNLSISFKDYGAGIPPNKMSDIYLKYGASDKRNTNKLTGGFGLGAKTPFAYNDTFTVITVAEFEGERKKYTYTAMLDSTGKGKMVLFDSTISEEPTGTTIIVPIKSDEDRYKFERDVFKYTKTWEDITYKNFIFSQPELDLAYEDEDVVIYKTGDYLYQNMELLIDGIPYPLDTNLVDVEDTIGRSDGTYLTVLKFETGDLSISANRESVQYDDDTIASIKAKFELVGKSIERLMVTHMENQETYLKACVFTYYVNTASSKQRSPDALTGALLAHAKSTNYKFKEATWKGLKTVPNFQFKHHTAHRVTLVNGKNHYEPIRDFKFHSLNADSVVYYGDARKNSARNVNLWDKGIEVFTLITPDNIEDRRGIEEFMTFIFTFDMDFNIYSDLPVVRNTANRTGMYQKKEFVTLNVGEYSHGDKFDKTTIKVDRKTFTTNRDSSKVALVFVDSLRDGLPYSTFNEIKFLQNSLSYRILKVRMADYENWFQHTGFESVKEVYAVEKEKYDRKVISENKEKVLNQLILEAVHAEVRSEFVPLVESILPKVCQGREAMEHVRSSDLEIVKKTLKFDFAGLEDKLKRIFEDRYPLLKTGMGDYRFTHEQKLSNLTLYIKQVNNFN